MGECNYCFVIPRKCCETSTGDGKIKTIASSNIATECTADDILTAYGEILFMCRFEELKFIGDRLTFLTCGATHNGKCRCSIHKNTPL